MNDILKQYLLEKYGTESPDEQVKKEYEDQKVNPFAAFASGVGQSLARQNPNLDWVDKQNNQAYDRTVGKLEADKKNAYVDFSAQQDYKKVMEDDGLKAKLSDLNSPESKGYQTLASKMLPGQDYSKLNGTQILAQLPSLEKIYKYDADKQSRELDRQDRNANNSFRREELGLRKEEVKAEKLNKLTTQFGIANTEQDAKTLKDAYEEKSNFDNKINEMIKLREDNNGGAFFDREAVARGKQLSKDLLLSYKNMAKLGVLSASDEKIINAIIPADPLEYNSPMSAIQGQDPILHTLKSFKSDSDKDFNTKVKTRIRGGGSESNQSPSSFPKTITKDGKSATVSNESEYKEAKAEGWK
jgi:hypothetical protein